MAALTEIGHLTVKGTASLNELVTFNPTTTTKTGLSALQTIRGNLVIGGQNRGNTGMDSLGYFDELTSIGGDINIGYNTSLSRIGTFSALGAIGGFLNIRDNAALKTLGNFSELDSIESVFNVYNNRILSDLGNFSALEKIGSFFALRESPALGTLGDFSSLVEVGTSFFVAENEGLIEVGNFSALEKVGENFVLLNCDGLTQLGNFTALTSVGGLLNIRGNFNLQSLGDLSALTSVEKAFAVRFNYKLTDLGDLSALINIGKTNDLYVPSEETTVNNVSIIVEENPNLFACCELADFLPAQTNAPTGSVFINLNSTSCNVADSGTDTEKFDAFSAACETTIFTLQSQIDNFDFATNPPSNIILGPSSGSDAITNISELSEVATLSNLVIRGNQNLQFIDNPADDALNGLGSLTTINGNLTISDNPLLTNLDGFALLTSVGNINVYNNALLRSLNGLSALESSGDIAVEYNPSLLSLGNFPDLTQINGNYIHYDTKIIKKMC